MCGIHGVIAFSGTLESPEILARKMGDITVHRGPDDSGYYHESNLMIGMRRLSIIDLDSGHQPICNEDRTIWLVCNGEIYNYRELRADLKRQGHVFRTNSDSEVIIHLYEEYGEALVERLNGMFGFALWDSVQKKMLIGRDHLGIKPLYYYQAKNKLIFASELKSILSVENISKDLSSQALHQFFLYGYVSAPVSIFEDVHKLEPATLLVINRDGVKKTKYWVPKGDLDESLSEKDWIEQTRSMLEKSVQRQMVSDVPLGAFLSGGIDSSAVVAMMASKSDVPIKTYSIGFSGDKASNYYNELPYARQVAEIYGTEHKEILVKPDVVNLLPKLLWHMDEPISDSALVTTYLVSKFAREDVTVILSGVGGDELFGGYRRYLGEYYAGMYNKLPNFLRSMIAQAVELLPSDRHSPVLNIFRYAKAFVKTSGIPFEDKYSAYMKIYDDKNTRLLLGDNDKPDDIISNVLSSIDDGDTIFKMFMADLNTQLPDDLLLLTDKMSMATSLECRVPLLDKDLVELSARMPGKYKIKSGELKYILKKSLTDLLPKEILYRKKRGFGAPMGAWIKNDLTPMVADLLSKESIVKRNILDYGCVEKIIFEHNSSAEDHTDLLLSMINFEIWSRMYLDGESHESVSENLSSSIQH